MINKKTDALFKSVEINKQICKAENNIWNIKTIKEAGLELPSKYFIKVSTNYYKFNTDAIKEDFPGKDIKTPKDLKQAIDEKETEKIPAATTEVKTSNLVGQGSWRTQAIKDAGLELPSKYFIGVYTDYYRFNPDEITADFPNQSIQTLEDLKQAIGVKNTTKFIAPVLTPEESKTQTNTATSEIYINGGKEESDVKNDSGINKADDIVTDNSTQNIPKHSTTFLDELIQSWVERYLGTDSGFIQFLIPTLYRMCQDGLQLKHDAADPNDCWESNDPNAELIGSIISTLDNIRPEYGNSASDYSYQFGMRLLDILSYGVPKQIVTNPDGSYYCKNSTEYYANINNNMAAILEEIGATKGEYNLYTNIDFDKFMKYILNATEPPYNSVSFGTGKYNSLAEEIDYVLNNEGLDSIPYDSTHSNTFRNAGLVWGGLPYDYRYYMDGTAIFDDLDYFPPTTGNQVTVEEYYYTNAMCYIPTIHYMTETNDVYNGYNLYAPPQANGRPKPPYFRVSINNNNRIFVSDDSIKCVQLYLNELTKLGLSCQNDEYCQMFGFTESDANNYNSIKQKMNAVYKDLGGQKGADGNYYLSWGKYYEKLSMLDIKCEDRVHPGIEGSPHLGIITRGEAEENVEKMNFWIDACNAVVDYGFTLADIYALKSTYSLSYDSYGNGVVTKNTIKRLIENHGEADSANPEFIKALKNAAQKLGGVDKLLDAWFSSKDSISPEELLARLTGGHPDSKGECYVTQKRYSAELVYSICNSDGCSSTNEQGGSTNNRIDEMFIAVAFDSKGNPTEYILRPGQMQYVFSCLETVPDTWLTTPLEKTDEQLFREQLGITEPLIPQDKFVNPDPIVNMAHLGELFEFCFTELGQSCLDSIVTINPDGTAVVHLQDNDEYAPAMDIPITKEELSKIVSDMMKRGYSADYAKAFIFDYALEKLVSTVMEKVLDYADKYYEENGTYDGLDNILYKIPMTDDENPDFFGIDIEALSDKYRWGKGFSIDNLTFSYLGFVDISGFRNVLTTYQKNGDRQAAMDLAINHMYTPINFTETLYPNIIDSILSSAGKNEKIDNHLNNKYNHEIRGGNQEQINKTLEALKLYSNAGIEFSASFGFHNYTGLDGYTYNQYVIVNVDGNCVYYKDIGNPSSGVQMMTIDELKEQVLLFDLNVYEPEDSVANKLARYSEEISQIGETLDEKTEYRRSIASQYEVMDVDEIEAMKLYQMRKNNLTECSYVYLRRMGVLNDNKGNYYIWDSFSQEMVYLGHFEGDSKNAYNMCDSAIKNNPKAFRAYYTATNHLTPTTTENVYVNALGVYYKFLGRNGILSGCNANAVIEEITDCENPNHIYKSGYVYTETSVPEVYAHNGEFFVFLRPPSGSPHKVDSLAEGKAVAEMKLYPSFCPNVYQSDGNKYYFWNTATKQMERINANINTLDAYGSQLKGTPYYGTIKALREGYTLTDKIGIFQKMGKYYSYDAAKDTFVPRTSPLYVCANDYSGLRIIKDESDYNVYGSTRERNAIAQKQGLSLTSVHVYPKGEYAIQKDTNSGKYYIFNPTKATWEQIDNYDPSKGASSLKGTKAYCIYCAYNSGYNFTNYDGIFEKDGFLYYCDDQTGKFYYVSENIMNKVKITGEYYGGHNT